MSERLAAWQELSRLTVDCDRIDRRYFRELIQQSGTLDRAASRAAAAWPEGLSLLQDIFSSLFKPYPVLKAATGVRPSAVLNHAVIRELMACPEWERLRQTTVLDKGAAVLAAMHLLDFLLREAERDRALREAVQAGRNAERAERRTGAMAYGSVSGAEDALSEAESWGSAISEAAAEARFALGNAAYGAALRARCQIERAITSLDGLGVSDTERRSLPLDEQLVLMTQAVHPNMVRIARLADQYRQARRGRLERQIRRPIGEMCSIERGRALSQMLPSELALLGHPLGRAEFLRRWSEGQTMQYAFLQRARASAPPVILLLDTSGSTKKWVVEGKYQRRHWVAGVAVAFLDMARAEGRDLVTVHFGTVSPDGGQRTETQVVRRFPGGEAGPGERLRLAATWVGGGTPFFGTYRRAAALMRETPSLRGADVVCVTDGELGGWTEQLQEEVARDKKGLGYRFIGVVVGEGREECFGPLADTVMRVEMNEEGFLTLVDAVRRQPS